MPARQKQRDAKTSLFPFFSTRDDVEIQFDFYIFSISHWDLNIKNGFTARLHNNFFFYQFLFID